MWGALSRAVCVEKRVNSLLGAGVLGDSLGALADGVLGQFTGEQETDSGLDFSARDGGPAVVVGKTGGLGSDALEDVVDERVHDAHGLAGDTSVGVHLLQHLVDVDAVALPPPPLPLLLSSSGCLGLAGGLLGSLRCCLLGWHVSRMLASKKMMWPDRRKILLTENSEPFGRAGCEPFSPVALADNTASGPNGPRPADASHIKGFFPWLASFLLYLHTKK